VIEQRSEGRGMTGVRIGDGSLYDGIVEQILGGGEVAVAGDGEEDVEWAMQLLASARAGRRRAITRTVEAAFEEVARRPRRRRQATGST